MNIDDAFWEINIDRTPNVKHLVARKLFANHPGIVVTARKLKAL
jgi:hypothetical protein